MSSAAFTWISPYHPDDARGGWKSMQFHLLRALEAQLGPARRIAPVEVAEEFFGKWASRIQKQLGIPRRYAYYSESRLAAFADAVHARRAADSAPVVFFGPLPFVKCRPAAPYYIYTDGAFFIHYREYNQDHSHDPSDIKRIEAAEAEFMQRSSGVWCSSQWVADRITREYGLEPGKAIFVGTGPGDVPPPVAPVSWGNDLVMIAADFERKGGRLAVEAVAEARKLGADISLKFIGAEPPPEVLTQSFVEWCGWLDLKTDAGRAKFAKILSQAAAQILLSRNDLTPLAIAEAGTYSKATIATAVGGIPEMIKDNQTGWLIRPDAAPAEIGAKLAEIFQQPDRLAEAGAAAAAFGQGNWSWQSVSARCLANLAARK
jgi:glycosyltransferase involved in cell wall biosynthesis